MKKKTAKPAVTCTNCKHYTSGYALTMADYTIEGTCHAPKAPISNFVLGTNKSPREINKFGQCPFFEPKPKPIVVCTNCKHFKIIETGSLMIGSTRHNRCFCPNNPIVDFVDGGRANMPEDLNKDGHCEFYKEKQKDRAVIIKEPPKLTRWQLVKKFFGGK